MTRAMPRAVRAYVAAGLAAFFTLAVLPAAASAGKGREQRTSIAVGAPGVHIATRLNTPRRFFGPLATTDAVKAMMARPGMTRDLEAVFRAGGVEYLAAQAAQVMTAASPDALKLVSVPVGQKFEWMAQRIAGQPSVLTNVEWRGTAPFEAYQFFLDDGVHGYTLVLPKPCGNLALVTTGPSPRADAAEAARRADDARKADDARRADEVRRAAAAADAAKRTEDARLAEDARKADEARRAEEARKAEAERLAAEARQQSEAAAERDRRAKVDVFLDVLGGKERRVRELAPATGTTAAVEGGRCAGLAGVKAGPDIRLGTAGWRFAPAVGVAVNVRDTDNTSLFGEAELNYWMGDKGFIGIGAGAWDVTHSDTFTGAGLIHFGRELGRTANDVRFLVVGEGRLFFDQLDDIKNNYQAWAGLRVVFR